MRIDIWSDIACPWCYVGKRRLESALGELAADGRVPADAVEVVWHSFQLDPGAPGQGQESYETAQQMLARKYGMSREQAAEAQDNLTRLAAAEGMTWQHDRTVHSNTHDGHRLLHLAAEHGLQGELKEALLRANFVEARTIADHDTLREVALAVGLPAARVEQVLAGDEFADAVRADIDRARAYGATGVPFFVLDDKYGISGAQPTEVFARAVEQAYVESRPRLQVLATAGDQGSADGACGPDGCAI